MKKILSVLAIAATSIAVGATAAGAGSSLNLGDITVDPSSGPAGTVVTVSGDDCAFPQQIEQPRGEPSPFQVDLWFEAGEQSAQAPAQQGSWSHEFTVPEGTAPGVYLITAACYNGEGEIRRLLGTYNDGEFTVPEPPTTTTVAPTTTAAPTTTVAPTSAAPTTTVAPATTQAAAAEAELPRTGGDPTALLAIGAASLGGGLTAFAARRRTRTRR